jgi:hypothetical protein
MCGMSFMKVLCEGKGDESGQTCVLTFDEISGRRMRELGSGSFIEIVDLDVS